MSMDYDEARWEDMEMEAQQDRWYEMIDTEIDNRKIDVLIQSVKDGYTDASKCIANTITEIGKLNSEDHPLSLSFHNLALLEIIERDVLFFPLLFSSKNLLSDTDGAINALIKNSIGSNTTTKTFVYRLYDHEGIDFTDTKSRIDTLISNTVPDHETLRPLKKSRVASYREMASDLRNYIAHGRHLASTEEANFTSEFVKIWKDEVFNPILKKYSLSLNKDWKLI